MIPLLVLACKPQIPPEPPVAPKPTSAELRSREEQERAGVDYFFAAMEDRPALWWAAYRAASEGLAFCERSRQQDFSCLDKNVARYKAVLAARPTLGELTLPPSGVRWTIQAADGCDDVLASLAPPPPPPSPSREATLTLESCEITRAPSVWTAGICPLQQRADPCADGSTPQQLAPGCPPGAPCAARNFCPCTTLDRPVHIDVRGRIVSGESSYALDVRKDWHEGGSVWTDEPIPPDPVGVRDIIEPLLVGGLPLATSVLDLLESQDPDTLAIRCATFRTGSTSSARDPFEMEPLAQARCADAYLRDPALVVPAPEPEPAPEPAPVPPEDPLVSVDRYPYRARVLDEAKRRATEADLERRSPGWDFDVSALGFIESGSFNPPDRSMERWSEAVRALAVEHHLALGFDTPPEVRGDNYRFLLVEGDRYVELRGGSERGTLRAHTWPFSCPEPDRTKILAPFLGRQITVTPLFQPCDPVLPGDCPPQDLTPKPEKLAPQHIGTRSLVAILPSDEGEVELHCAISLHLDAKVTLRGGSPLPAVIDAFSGESLQGALIESMLPAR